MDHFLDSASRLALSHLNQQQGKYTALLGALAFGTGFSWINQYLSANALNHGTPADFNWDEEIVLVTGGAGGIGGEIVQKMAERGTRVVVLDVMDLTYTAGEWLDMT
jgi:3-oxoacyl-ACP reductase-like protein